MPAKRFAVEQIIAKLREAEKLQGEGLTIPQTCKRAADLGPDLLPLAAQVRRPEGLRHSRLERSRCPAAACTTRSRLPAPIARPDGLVGGEGPNSATVTKAARLLVSPPVGRPLR